MRAPLRVSASLVCLALAAAAEADEPLSRTPCLGSPREYPKSEQLRRQRHREVAGTWPPPFTYPGRRPRHETEEAGWAELMEGFEARVRRLDGGQRWEEWLQLAQMRLLKNYTSRGFLHTTLDPAVHQLIAARFASSYRAGEHFEGEDPLFIDGQRELWDVKALPRELEGRMLDDIRGKIARWAKLPPEDLAMTARYGFRVYLNGSVLHSHVDRVETHVLSAVYCLDLAQEEGAPPWLLGAEVGFDGLPAWVDLRPGELFLYESAKLPHGRPTAFVGERYVALFVHFRPGEWCVENYDRVYSLPDDWQEREPQPRPPLARAEM